MQAWKALWAVTLVAAAIALIGVAALAQDVMAGGTGVSVCVGSKEGKAIVTPVKGACRKGYALVALGTEGPEGKQGPEGKEGLPATRLFAEVGEGGELLHGSGVTGVVESGSRQIFVTFSQDVSSCVPVATSEEPANSNGVAYKKVLIAVSHHESNTIVVSLEGIGGNNNTVGIDLAVFC
jgi:hypothetical protein